MLADFRTKFLQYSRRFSFGETSRDTGVSNPPRSAKQSASFALSPEKWKIPRILRRLLFGLRAPENLRFGSQELIHAGFSLPRNEPVPFARSQGCHRCWPSHSKSRVL